MFDSIPEDRELSYPCEECDEGNVNYNESNDRWECDNCGFSRRSSKGELNA